MKLGIGLPTALTPPVNRGLLLDWARVADQAGFHTFGTVDHPGYDAWDPLVCLAAAAAVTERVRLATTILQLPNRSELMVAHQAATIDRLSGGRLDLGVSVGFRETDYAALGVKMRNRGKKIDRQIRRIRKTWRTARRGTDEAPSADGPAPLQKPAPAIWIGGSVQASVDRAFKLGDGYVFTGGATPEQIAPQAAAMRERATAEKKRRFTIVGIRYCAVGDAAALDQAAALTERYYGGLWAAPEDIFLHGEPDDIARGVKAYEEAGLDVLILFPQVPEIRQVELIGEHVLPAYRIPGR